MEPSELPELQEIFDSVDTSDPDSLRLWFDEYPELTMNERCQITGRSSRTICRWRRKAQVTRKLVAELGSHAIIQKYDTPPPPKHTPPPKPVPSICIPPDWDKNSSWMLNHNISIKQFSFILKCSRNKIRRMLRDAKPIPDDTIRFINGL